MVWVWRRRASEWCGCLGNRRYNEVLKFLRYSYSGLQSIVHFIHFILIFPFQNSHWYWVRIRFLADCFRFPQGAPTVLPRYSLIRRHVPTLLLARPFTEIQRQCHSPDFRPFRSRILCIRDRWHRYCLHIRFSEIQRSRITGQYHDPRQSSWSRRAHTIHLP